MNQRRIRIAFVLLVLNIRIMAILLTIITTISVLGSLADASAKLPESEGDRAAQQTQKGQKGRGPLVAHAVVHLLSEQDGAGTPEGTNKSLGGERGRGLVLVRVDQVVVGCVIQENEAEADGEAGEAGADPDQARVRGPGEDEEADGDEPARDHHGDQPDLGGRLAVVFLDLGEVVLVDNGGAHGRADDSHRERDEHEARLAVRVALAALEDDGVGDEEHVEKTVEDRHVERDEQHDELAEQELEGPNQEDGHALREGTLVEIALGHVRVVTGLLAEVLGAATEDGGCVGLLDGEGDEDPDDEGQDELDPVEPAPAGEAEPTTDERTDCGGFG